MTLDSFYTNAPLVLAHRGASHDAPENTLAAFALARKMGADGVELDTSLTRDGVPVVIHDLNLDKTTNGQGLVQALDLKAIKALDAGSHFSADFKGEQVPTLDEVFEALGTDVLVNVELKTESWRDNGLESAVYKVIRKHNHQRILISSFNPFALRRMRALAPDIPMGYLYAPDEPIYLRKGWFMIGVRHEAKHPHHSMINAAFMAWARANRYRVNTWTVDDPARMRELRGLGVDAIFTNRPDVALRELGRTTS
jgi:glycerophosphoryl diester phosphodiesterase